MNKQELPLLITMSVTGEEKSSISTVHKVYAFGDIHGDYTLLKHLLVSVARVAEVHRSPTKIQDEWSWRSTLQNTTVIVCGDFTDRFRSSILDQVTTEGAIAEETQIIHAFTTLKNTQHTLQNVKLVVLLGNHEMVNLEKDIEFLPYQVENASSLDDIRKRYRFVDEVLRPFVEKYVQLVYVSRDQFCFCHAGLHYDWVKQTSLLLKAWKGIEEDLTLHQYVNLLNRLWSYTVKHHPYITDDRANSMSHYTRELRQYLLHNDSLLWTRVCGKDPQAYKHNHLRKLEQYWDTKLTICVGHTGNTQVHAQLRSKCNINSNKYQSPPEAWLNSEQNSDSGYILKYGSRSQLFIIFLDCLSSRTFDSYEDYISTRWKFRRPTVLLLLFQNNNTVKCETKTLNETAWAKECHARTRIYDSLTYTVKMCRKALKQLNRKSCRTVLQYLWSEFVSKSSSSSSSSSSLDSEAVASEFAARASPDESSSVSSASSEESWASLASVSEMKHGRFHHQRRLTRRPSMSDLNPPIPNLPLPRTLPSSSVVSSSRSFPSVFSDE